MDTPGQNGELFDINEPWLMEWFEWGWKSLERFLGRQAAFAEWDAAHPRPPVEDDPALD